MAETDQILEEQLVEFAFGEVTDAGRDIFLRLGREYKDGETIFEEGSEGTFLVIVLSGAVAISERGADGAQLELARLGAGEIFGEMSHFDDLPRSATARALGRTSTLLFNRENFSLIFQLHPKWTTTLVEGLAQRIRRALAGMEQMAGARL